MLRLTAFLVALLMTLRLVAAADPIAADAEGLAIQGYDPVAYFTLGAATPGAADHEEVWQGVRWRFSNEDHLQRFEEDPERYAPRYGGFCSGAMIRGEKATVDPEAFAIIDGKLYLNFSREGIARFEANADVTIPAADANWERLRQAE